MTQELELIVIGDDLIREKVYSSFSDSVEKRQRKAQEPPFPSLSQGNATAISRSTSATFTLNNNQIRYGITEYTNNKDYRNDSEITNPSSYLLKKHLTLVICINEDATDLELARFDAGINYLKSIRGKQHFNIIPMVITSHNHNQPSLNAAYLKEAHPQLCRDAIFINEDDLNNPKYTQHLSMTLNISLATPIYNEIQNCIELLSKLQKSLAETPLKPVVTKVTAPELFDVTPILNILKPSLNMIGSTDVNTIDALRGYFNENRKNLNAAFAQLKVDLDNLGERNQTYIGGIFLNVLCAAIAAIFASLTIVGIPLVGYALYQNNRYHNNCFKFFATNNIDAERANIVKVEDEINRTVFAH